MNDFPYPNIACHDKEAIYLNYAATSFPKSKIALESFLKATGLPPGGSRQNQSNRHMKNLKMRTGKVLNTSEEHIFFTSSATMGLNQVILGFMKGAHCLAIDNRSHNSIVRTWLSLKDRRQCIVAPLYNQNDEFIDANLTETLSKSPDLLCLTHVSNVNGSIYPVEKIIDLVQLYSPSTSILIDASQSAGALDLSTLNKADFIVFPSHKHLHSVQGAAVLVAKKRLEPIIFGGTGANSMAEETLSNDDIFAEVGTINLPAIQALVDSLEFAESTLNDHKKLENSLVNQFIKGVDEIGSLKIIGRNANDNRVGIVALKTDFGSPELLWTPFLRSQNILVRGGLHCSPLHHKQLGLSNTGTLRISFGWDSTPEHVVKALQALKEFSNVTERILNDSAA